jgi:hypothetical protein
MNPGSVHQLLRELQEACIVSVDQSFNENKKI